MRYNNIKNLPGGAFRRATGVKKKTFEEMLSIISKFEIKKKKRGGRPNKLSVEDRLLMTLAYLREYRTYFHIAQSFGIAESVCYENTRAIENILIKDGTFNLPKRKEIVLSDDPIEVILVDAAESPIERPKKKDKTPKKPPKTLLFRKKEAAYDKDTGGGE
jgi:hypothetical protein